MKVLYFDCFSGISGDMVLGAFIDLGVDPEYLKGELGKLNLTGFSLHYEKTNSYGIGGTSFDVVLEGDHHAHHHDHSHKQCHVNDSHSHVEEGHHHEHNHEEKGHSRHPHRSYRDIKKIILDSSLSENVKKTSIAIFDRVARAEAKVHGVSVDDVHFHEVGALDSIVDIVGAAICYHVIAADAVYSSAVNVGRGFVKCAHGVLPVPAPATAEIFSETDFSIYSRNIEGEAATPTGAAIIAELGKFSPEMPDLVPEKTGYGFGKRDFGTLNALRIFIGQRENNATSVAVIETNIDDMTGEGFGYVMELLFSAGALDVFYSPIYMKKNRPAYKLTVIAEVSSAEDIEKLILKETSAIGLRRVTASRKCMDRSIETRSTDLGEVRVKVCSMGDVRKETLEYEDVKRIALEKGMAFNDTVKMLEKKINS